MRPILRLLALFAFIVAPRTLAQSSPSLDDAAFQIARDFAAVINGTDDAVVKTFEEKYRAPARLAERPMPERISRTKQLRSDWGGLKLTKAVNTDKKSVRAMAETSNGQSLDLTFELDDAGKLDAIRIAISTGAPPPEAKALDKAERAKIVQAACKALEERYVYPEVAGKMATLARGKLNSGGYDQINSDEELARQLTDDFRGISKDRHLGVRVMAPSTQARGDDRRLVDMAGDNFGYRKVEVLPGNIGYLRLDLFVSVPEALQRATAAMGFLADVDGLIVDLRHNGGGDPKAIQFITSYLFDEPTHLNDMVDREGNVVEEFWTLKEVPGKRLRKGVPVCVLTSSYTFSGAEEFSYNLKNLKRATLVGETTGGGAHPVMGVRLTDRVNIGVPFQRARNPISQTNWEGTGVAPDIAVPADEALDRALMELRSKTEKSR